MTSVNLQTILKDSRYTLSQFNATAIEDLEHRITLKPNTKGDDIPYVTCLVRNKNIKLTPEEIVRQLYLDVLINHYDYPVSRLAIEYQVVFGREKKRADIVIYDKNRPDVVYVIVELKKPKLQDGKAQLKSYCNATGAPLAVWTNGDKIEYYHRKDPNLFEEVSFLPHANQKLGSLFDEKLTITDLIEKNKHNKKTLKERIQEMEDEVLANAGVDVFEECFKLIFTKLYDEWESGRNTSRYLQFRNNGTEQELKEAIQALFDKAKQKWQGVFSTYDTYIKDKVFAGILMVNLPFFSEIKKNECIAK